MLISNIRQLGNLRFSYKILVALVCLLPFSPFLVTLIGTRVDGVITLTLWKEALLGLIALFLTFYWLRTERKLPRLLKHPLILAILGYILYMLADTLVRGNFTKTAGAGLLVNSRFLIAFLVAGFIAARLKNKLPERFAQIVIQISMVVSVLALVIFILPNFLLETVGYDPQGSDAVGVPASEYFVSKNVQIERAQSTMRSPNSLGLFLLLSIALILFDSVPLTKKQQVGYLGLFLAIALLTFSRAVLVGLVLIFAIWLIKNYQASSRKLKKQYIISLGGLLLVVIVSGILVSQQPSVSELFFHQTEGQANGSTSIRLSEYQDSLNKIVKNPLGEGVGSASVAGRAEENPAITTTENYYLQIGRELGIIGLTLFICVNAAIFWQLRKLKSPLKLPLLSVFIAFVICSLFLPVWGEETVSITFFTMLGLALFQVKQIPNKT